MKVVVLVHKGRSEHATVGVDRRFVAMDYVLLGVYTDALHWLSPSVQFDPRNVEA